MNEVQLPGECRGAAFEPFHAVRCRIGKPMAAPCKLICALGTRLGNQRGPRVASVITHCPSGPDVRLCSRQCLGIVTIIGSVTPRARFGAAGGMGSSFVGLPRDGTTGTDRDKLRRLWLGGGDRAARPDSTRLSSVPVPGLRQTVQRTQRRCPQSTSLPSDVIAFVVFCRLRYRLTLRDLSKIMLLRGFTVSHEFINADWTALVDAWRASDHPSMDRVRKGELPMTTTALRNYWIETNRPWIGTAQLGPAGYVATKKSRRSVPGSRRLRLSLNHPASTTGQRNRAQRAAPRQLPLRLGHRRSSPRKGAGAQHGKAAAQFSPRSPRRTTTGQHNPAPRDAVRDRAVTSPLANDDRC